MSRAQSATRTLAALARKGIPARAVYIGDRVIIETLTPEVTAAPMPQSLDVERDEIDRMLKDALRSGL